jgi:hypothetical protein
MPLAFPIFKQAIEAKAHDSITRFFSNASTTLFESNACYWKYVLEHLLQLKRSIYQDIDSMGLPSKCDLQMSEKDNELMCIVELKSTHNQGKYMCGTISLFIKRSDLFCLVMTGHHC